MTSTKLCISVVVPCFNEAKNIPLIVSSLETVLKTWKYEIILVDDGSTDGSAKIYGQLAEFNRRIKFLRFSRNFGHQAALKAGIDHATGDAIVTIDADLQQPPTMIPTMIQKWEEGADIVEGVRRAGDSETWFKRKTSRLFYKILDYVSDYPVIDGVSDFRLIDKKVAKIVGALSENYLYLRGLFSWMGFERAYVEYELKQRQNGRTRYTLMRMASLASSGMTSMSIKPLRIALLSGIIVSLFSFFYAIYALFISVYTDEAIPGWTSTIMSVLFMAGFQLIILGIMGEYLGKLFMEGKRRPIYLLAETNLNTEQLYSQRHSIHNKEYAEGGCAVT